MGAVLRRFEKGMAVAEPWSGEGCGVRLLRFKSFKMFAGGSKRVIE